MSKVAALCLALFLLCAALPGPVEGQAPVTITVSGTVTGPSGPVTGMAVSCRLRHGRSRSVDQRGRLLQRHISNHRPRLLQPPPGPGPAPGMAQLFPGQHHDGPGRGYRAGGRVTSLTWERQRAVRRCLSQATWRCSPWPSPGSRTSGTFLTGTTVRTATLRYCRPTSTG